MAVQLNKQFGTDCIAKDKHNLPERDPRTNQQEWITREPRVKQQERILRKLVLAKKSDVQFIVTVS